MPKIFHYQAQAQAQARARPLPRYLKPRNKLSRHQVQDLHLLHIQLLHHIHAGDGDEFLLWEFVAMALTWSHAAEMLGLGMPEIAPQLELATRLIYRWRDTGQVRYEGIEYQVARVGTIVMDLLAEAVDEATAVAASHWSEYHLKALRLQHAGPAC